LKLEDNPIPEASTEEAIASNNTCTNKIGPSKAGGQDSSAATRDDKETSSTNNIAQASVPKVEDKEGRSSTLPMHLGGWPTSPSQWIWTVPALPIETGADRIRDEDNLDLMRLPLDLPEAQPTMPASNADKQDTSLKTAHVAAKDVMEQTSSISMMNLIPTKNWNLLTRLPKSVTSLTQ